MNVIYILSIDLVNVLGEWKTWSLQHEHFFDIRTLFWNFEIAKNHANLQKPLRQEVRIQVSPKLFPGLDQGSSWLMRWKIRHSLVHNGQKAYCQPVSFCQGGAGKLLAMCMCMARCTLSIQVDQLGQRPWAQYSGACFISYSLTPCQVKSQLKLSCTEI